MFSRGTNHYHNHGLESISSCAEAVRQIRRKQKHKSSIYSNKVDGQKVFRKEREYTHGFFNGQSVHKSLRHYLNALHRNGGEISNQEPILLLRLMHSHRKFLTRKLKEAEPVIGTITAMKEIH